MPPLIYSPDVQAAHATGQPIVALESTIITHGMPYEIPAAWATRSLSP